MNTANPQSEIQKTAINSTDMLIPCSSIGLVGGTLLAFEPVRLRVQGLGIDRFGV